MRGKKHMIAAGDKVTVEAAKVILEAGGNAYDAAVSACFTAMVAEPALTSAGGGGYLMAYPAEGKPILFDFFVDMPSGTGEEADLDFLGIDVDFGGTTQEFHIGKGSVAVPGNVAGLLHVHRRLGSVPLKTVLEPAFTAAKEGIILSDVQAYLLKILEPIFTHDDRGRALFAPEGSLLEGGSRLAMPEFAGFLDSLAHEGAELVHKGEVAKIIADWVSYGGLILKEDMENYQVLENSPLVTPFHGHTVLLNPPPALSGILIDFTLSLLEAAGCTKSPPILLRTLISAFDVTNLVRSEKLRIDALKENLRPLSKEPFFPSYLARFRNLAEAAGRGLEAPSVGSTTQISILDKKRNAASVTTTNGEGCGYILPEVGFMLNNMLGEEDINPGGFHRYPKGARLSSMLAPTVVLDNGKPCLVSGTAGSNRIRSVIVQLLTNFLCNGLDIHEATVAPRVHLEGGVLHAEPGVSEDVLQELEGTYAIERWKTLNVFFGGANSVTQDRGAGDPRRGGYALSF